MHDCLQVTEIVDLIFKQVYYDSPPGRSANKTLLALATTCHDFEELALNIMWHTQSNLVRLIKVLPSHCWQEEPKTGFDRIFTMTRKPLENEITRLVFYAQRIRTIKYLWGRASTVVLMAHD
ncbi:hypothetical protein BDZ97DRAFT_1401270 [Flammula alnicola]|nr:hypothetical protein BDZ97DRAFT_1401270 [Flammula alnicola]